MKSTRNLTQIVACVFLLAPLILISPSCTQYDYSSPLPGVVDIRLHTISDSSQIPFSPLNKFVIKVTEVTAIRSDYARAEIYADIDAVRRKDATVYNTLDFRAQDSSLVLGVGYLPPGDYIGVNMLITPGDAVLLDGYRNIFVNKEATFAPELTFRKPFHVSEQHTTKIVLSINLDSSLVKQSDTYLFKPYYFISSIQYE